MAICMYKASGQEQKIPPGDPNLYSKTIKEHIDFDSAPLLFIKISQDLKQIARTLFATISVSKFQHYTVWIWVLIASVPDLCILFTLNVI